MYKHYFTYEPGALVKIEDIPEFKGEYLQVHKKTKNSVHLKANNTDYLVITEYNGTYGYRAFREDIDQGEDPGPNDDIPILEAQSIGPEAELLEDEHATIRVLAFYTPKAKQSYSNIEHRIIQSMEDLQIISDNSECEVTWDLVAIEEIDYDESKSMWDTVYDFKAGRIANTKELRQKHQADIVWMTMATGEYGGLGFRVTNSNGNPDTAFSISKASMLSGFVPAHEIGHNAGMHHHKDQNTSPGPGGWPYSCGWRWTDGTRKLCDVMCYTSGIYFDEDRPPFYKAKDYHKRVPYFSNPDVNNSGYPGEANNARLLREMKHVLSKYHLRIQKFNIKAIFIDPDGKEHLSQNTTIGYGRTTSFKLDVPNNWEIDSVTGSNPGGSIKDDKYTTNTITDDAEYIFKFKKKETKKEKKKDSSNPLPLIIGLITTLSTLLVAYKLWGLRADKKELKKLQEQLKRLEDLDED